MVGNASNHPIGSRPHCFCVRSRVSLKLILVVLLLLPTAFAVRSQQQMELYSGLPPNSLPTDLEEANRVVTTTAGTTRFDTIVVRPTISIYLPEVNTTRTGVIIFPGGAYLALATELEGERVAKRLVDSGIAAFVVRYRLPYQPFLTNKHIVPLQDAQTALRTVREHAERWGLDSTRIGVMGSSAGGHLAALTATRYTKPLIPNPNAVSLRPDFLILNYPVLSLADDLTHLATRASLLGMAPGKTIRELALSGAERQERLAGVRVDPELVRELSPDLLVTPDTPPTFITHAADDRDVGVETTVRFIASLQQNNVPVQAFFYATGGHGYGVVNPGSEKQWIDACIEWIVAINRNA